MTEGEKNKRGFKMWTVGTGAQWPALALMLLFCGQDLSRGLQVQREPSLLSSRLLSKNLTIKI
jgi:hypothetical protein